MEPEGAGGLQRTMSRTETRAMAETTTQTPPMVRWPLKVLLLAATAALGWQLLMPLYELVPACWTVTPISRPCVFNAGVQLLFVQLLLAGCLGAWLGRPWGAALWIVATMALPAGSVSTALRLISMALALGLGVCHGWRFWRARRHWHLGALAGGSIMAGLLLLVATQCPRGAELEIEVVGARWRVNKGSGYAICQLQVEVTFHNAGKKTMRLDLPDDDTRLPMPPLLQVAARDGEGQPLVYIRPQLCGDAYNWRRVSSVTLRPKETTRRSLTLSEEFFRRGKTRVVPATLRLRYDSSTVSIRRRHYLQTFARRSPDLKVRGESRWTRLLLRRSAARCDAP
jgi:hypothetical protein